MGILILRDLLLIDYSLSYGHRLLQLEFELKKLIIDFDKFISLTVLLFYYLNDC